MSIRFRCECGRVLMASDDQAGLEGQCPACGQLVPIPETEILNTKEAEEGVSAAQLDETETVEEASMGTKDLEDLERGGEGEVEDQPEKRGWAWSPRFAILASILVVVIVALVVFTLVRKERRTDEDVVIIEQIQPLVETEEETPVPPVGARLEEEAAESPQSEVTETIVSSTSEEELIEESLSEPSLDVETEVVTGEEEPEIVASTGTETPPAKTTLPTGAFTINVASFRQRERADRYVEELKKKGVDAFDWEIDLPEKGRWYRVSVGGFSTRREAENYANELRNKGISDTFITRVPDTS